MSEWREGVLDFGFLDSARDRDVVGRVLSMAPEFGRRASRNDSMGRFPAENFDDLHRAGLMAMQVPEEYGGLGLTSSGYLGAIAAMASGDASTALAYNMHSAALVSIGMLASEQQRRRWFGQVVRDGARVAALGSEPGLKPFLDGGLPRTTLRETSDGFRLSGRKTYGSFGGHADLLYVTATWEESVVFVVLDAAADGIHREDDWNVMSMRSTCSVTTTFDEVRVPANAVIRPRHPALAMLLEMEFALGQGPIYLATAASSCAQARATVEPEIDRVLAERDEGLLPEAERVFWRLGEMRVLLEPAWLMCQKAAATEPIGSFERAVAIVVAKAAASEVACSLASLALQLVGGRGLHIESPIGRALRDVQAGLVMAFSPDQARYMLGRFELNRLPPHLQRLREERRLELP